MRPALARRLGFSDFPPGSFSRQRYDALLSLAGYAHRAAICTGLIENQIQGREAASFEALSWRAGRLIDSCLAMAGLLERIKPAAALGLAEKIAKIGFYVRLSLDAPPPDTAPPHVVDRDGAPGFIVTAPGVAYLLEHAGLRAEIDKRLRLAAPCGGRRLTSTAASLAALIATASLPPGLAEAMTARAASLAAKHGPINASVKARFLPETLPAATGLDPIGCPRALTACIAAAYNEDALTARIRAGWPDGESNLRVVFYPDSHPPAGLATPKTGPAAARLAKIAPYLTATQLPAGERTPDSIESLPDAARYAADAAMAEAFGLARGQGRKPGPIRLNGPREGVPLDLDVIDTGGGLFAPPEQDGEAEGQHIRCLPLWSVWCGMAKAARNGGKTEPATGRAVAGEDALWLELVTKHGTLELDAAISGTAPRKNRIALRLTGQAETLPLGTLGLRTARLGGLITATAYPEGENACLKTLALLGQLVTMS